MMDASEKDEYRGDSRYSHLKWSRRDYRIPAIEAAKCHAAAFRSKVSVCYANPGELAPNGDLYDTIFPNDLPNDPEPFLLPFLLMKHGEQEFGYGSSKGEAWRRRGRYMFVFAAFRTLAEALRRARRLPEGTDFGPEHSRLVREVVADEDGVTRLLKLSDKVLGGFFSDSATDQKVNDDIFAFLKNGVEKPDSLKVLDLKVRYELGTSDGAEFIDRVRGLVRA